ncbi:L-serine ammonia-lyase, iron-sulfur-dependent subunit beta [Fulvivirga sedimenti]|uniref:L-serine dehydratase n=1 Tax=Fulvivirga sedimenti TaxID=2879465 RepID=A0A9X1HSH2_9BACT|nr:L-serine ammonia-lyase, iron-sulfur-dependent subunit beta [Fulvivirga sedimenti]MCA6074596.1 L-serine ammonia-lyase, iron-sulfur-dependent subunit beta [Fulvivirga sedimenti]MCA6075773.1 L-serine ammonia-lyase, iron-sulfur-dependent subunit beta [Fulvivirga sedimenti]MCA6076901.1 L-serine ammonia-lyase, iron-sulfur-dependent subunit beta [Fulvivirga sedimenti]
MSEKSGIFDMIGPVMIGPSSSHTAGVVRMARVAIRVLGERPDEATITFYNSFARTYEGHGSDKAAIAGLLDFKTDDERIRNSFDHAEKAGLKYTFKSVGNASTVHPNTVKFVLQKGDHKIEIIGESKGGGVINIAELDGFKADFSASLHTLIIKAHDVKGSIAHISSVLSHDHCNVATMSVSRKAKNDLACLVIEMDSGLKPVSLEYIKGLDWVTEVIYIPDIDV